MNIRRFCLFAILFLIPLSAFTQAPTEFSKTNVSNYIEGAESSILLLSDQCVNEQDDLNAIFGSAYQLLNQAQYSILILNYVYEDGNITEILNRKASEGVDVIVVYDRERSKNYTSKLHPTIRKFTRAKGEGHLHHKIIVVDHTYNWISSANFNAPTASNLAVVCADREMAEVLYQESYAIQSLQTRQQAQPYRTTIDGQILELYLLPHNDPKNQKKIETEMNEIAKKKLLTLIQQAQATLRVSMVVWTFKDCARELVEANSRGVKVEVVGAAIDNEVLNILRQGGVPCRQVGNAPYHHKWMLIDNQILWNGSANWSMNAFSRTDDSVTVIYNLKAEQCALMEDVWQSLIKIAN